MLPSRLDFLSTGLVPIPSSSTTSLPPEGCAICTDTFTDPTSLPCNHIFCKPCITQWLNTRHKNTCPTCRTALYALDDADRGPVGPHRLVAMNTALTHSGLLGGNYQMFNDRMYRNESDFMRATAQANTWLAEQHHPRAAGPAVVNTTRLGHHIIAMGNLLKGYARATGRAYNSVQQRDWRLVICALWQILEERDGARGDAFVLARTLKEEVGVALVMQGLRVEGFFDADAGGESCAGDFDVLLQYLARQWADEFSRREMRRAAVGQEPTLLGKVSVWFNQHWMP